MDVRNGGLSGGSEGLVYGKGEGGEGEGDGFMGAQEGGGIVDGEALVGDYVRSFGGGEGFHVGEGEIAIGGERVGVRMASVEVPSLRGWVVCPQRRK